VKIECNIDSKNVVLNVNSNKPLNKILAEEIEIPLMSVECSNSYCGNCIVLFDDEPFLACLIPAFRLKGAKITTFKGYQKSRFWHDIERAYEDTGSQPCPNCYASKTLIFESLLQTLAKNDPTQTEQEDPDEKTIINEISLNKCNCLDNQEILEIYKTAAMYRRRRRVRRY